MTYTPTTWVDDTGSGNGTVINAARLNNIESGVVAAVPAEVAALPASPTDGDTVDLLVDSAGTYGGPYVWRCRYRAATSGAAKWHVIGGGPPLERESTTNEANFSTSYANMALGTIVVPVAGEYHVELWTQQAFSDTAAAYGRFSYKIGAAAADDLDALVVRGDATGQNQTLSISFRRRKTLTAGVTLQPQAKSGAAFFYPTGNAAAPHGLRLYPIRIGP